MQPLMPERYPNWRQVYGAIERNPAPPADRNGETEYLRRKLDHLASLCLTSVRAHHQFVSDLKAYVTQAGREQDPELRQLVEDYGALALGRFTQNSDLALRMAIERLLDERPRVIVRPVPQPVATPQVHRPKSLMERILGG